MRTLKWLMAIMICALFLNAVSNNEKAMELLKKGNESFQVSCNPSQAFPYFIQAAAFASGYIKVEALRRTAYMSYLLGKKTSEYENFIKEAIRIDPDAKLEPIDYRDSFIQIYNEIKSRETPAEISPSTEPGPELTAAQSKSNKQASPPNPGQREPGTPLLSKKSAKPRRDEAGTFKRFSLRGSYFLGFTSETLASTYDPTIYREEASFVASYEAKKGNTSDAALGYRLSPVLGVEVGASIASRDVAVAITASVPHPLLFDAPRQVTGSQGYKLKETDLYLNLMYTLKMKSIGIDLFAGPCFVMAETTLVAEYQVTDSAYPYTAVNVSYGSKEVKKNAIGFNAGIAAGYYFGNSVGLVLSVRFISAKAKFDTATDVPGVDYKVGGLQAGVGLKIKF